MSISLIPSLSDSLNRCLNVDYSSFKTYNVDVDRESSGLRKCVGHQEL